MSTEEGWRSWIDDYPPDELVEIFREGWTNTHIVRPSEMNPAANVCGLYWRMTGIGKTKVGPRIPRIVNGKIPWQEIDINFVGTIASVVWWGRDKFANIAEVIAFLANNPDQINRIPVQNKSNGNDQQL